MLSPQIVGLWDANHLWLQWVPTTEGRYALRLRYQRPGMPQYGPWVETHTPWPMEGGCYRKIPTHAQGTRVQAQMAVWPAAVPLPPVEGNDGTKERLWVPPKADSLEWETAQGAKFRHCFADFVFRSELRKVTFAAGDVFTAMVDGDVASFRLPQEIEASPGVEARARLFAVQATGVHQLDHPRHFFLSVPHRGVTIENATASENDLEPTGEDSVVIEGRLPGGPMSIALGAVNQPRQ